MDAHSQETEVVRQLFQKHVPEVASGVVEIRGIAREVGVLSVLVVYSADGAVFDTVGACVGPRGSRVQEIVRELNGERIEIVRWSDSVESLIGNLVAANRVLEVSFDDATHVATVTLRPDRTPFPAGAEVPERVQTARLRLASRLVGWDIKIDSQNVGFAFE